MVNRNVAIKQFLINFVFSVLCFDSIVRREAVKTERDSVLCGKSRKRK